MGFRGYRRSMKNNALTLSAAILLALPAAGRADGTETDAMADLIAMSQTMGIAALPAPVSLAAPVFQQVFKAAAKEALTRQITIKVQAQTQAAQAGAVAGAAIAMAAVDFKCAAKSQDE